MTQAGADLDGGRSPGDDTLHLGWRTWGLGIALIGSVSLLLGQFDPGQPFPEALQGQIELVRLVAVVLVTAGAVVQWGRFRFQAAAFLTLYYGLLVTVLLNGPVVVASPLVFGAYSSAAEQLALAAAGLIVYAACAPIGPRRAARLSHIGRLAFGVCVLLFGGAHFAYMNLTAPLVPRWLPLTPVFWGEATGFAQIAAGLAIITTVQARLASSLLTIMYATFTPLVHVPLLLSAPHNAFYWSENALNVALAGSAWVVAESLRRPDKPHR